MPTDFQAAVYNAIFTLLLQGVTAYNAAIDAALLPGCKKVASNQVFDDRPAGSALPGRTVEKIAGRAPADYPQIRLQITGGSEPVTPTPTFGLQQGVTGTDAITPIVVTLKTTITWDTVKDAAQTPLWAYIAAALKSKYPNLGLSYCRNYSFNLRRSDRRIKDALRTVQEVDFTVTLWPHLAATQ